MKYILVVKWYDGSIEKHEYDTENEAITCLNGYVKAFGNQVWCCINYKRE